MPATAPTSPRPAPRARRFPARLLFHGGLFAAFLTISGTVLVWPRWIDVDGSRTAVETQREREDELSERLAVNRAMASRLRAWQHDERRVFTAEELPQYPALVKEAARRSGARCLGVKLTERLSHRWRPVSVEPAWDEADRDPGARIEPRTVHLVLTGSFPSVYGALTTLTQQQQLFIPESWSLSRGAGTAPGAGDAGSGEVRADVLGTLFVVSTGDSAPAPATAPAPDALLRGGVQG